MTGGHCHEIGVGFRVQGLRVEVVEVVEEVSLILSDLYPEPSIATAITLRPLCIRLSGCTSGSEEAIYVFDAFSGIAMHINFVAASRRANFRPHALFCIVLQPHWA